MPVYRFSNVFKKPLLEQIRDWFVLDPVSVFCVSLGALSISGIATGLYLSPAWFASTQVPSLILLCTALGAGVVGVGLLTVLAQDWIRMIPSAKPNYQTPAKQYERFETFDGAGAILSRLKYIDHLPVLFIKDDYDWGAGRIMGKAFRGKGLEVFRRYYDWLPVAVQVMHAVQWAIDVPRDFFQRLAGNAPEPHRYMPFWKKPAVFLAEKLQKLAPTFSARTEQLLEGLNIELNIEAARFNARSIVQQPYFTVDGLKAQLIIPDVIKLLACTAMVRRSPTYGDELLRTLDWPSFNYLHQHTVVVVRNLGLKEAPPFATASISFTPGLIGLSMINDAGLMITLNEATTMSTKRCHRGGMPEVVLIEDLISHCCTVDQVRERLARQPALSSHSLMVQDHQTASVFQMLPIHCEEYFTERPLGSESTHLVLANHHQDIFEQAVSGSASWPNSHARQTTAKRRLFKQNKNGFEMLESVNVPTTVHAMVLRRQPTPVDIETGLSAPPSLILSLKTNHGLAASSDVPSRELNLTRLFNEVKAR